jgi:DNA-binding transcriptional MerR regulator
MSAQAKAGERYLRIKEVAAMLSIHPNTVRLWVQDGLFGEILRLSPRDYRIAQSSLQSFINSRMA